MAASRSSLETVPSKPGGGETPILTVGGVPKMMMASKPNEIQLHLSQRKGFVKMAMEVGSTLVPCFVFGETETYNQSGPLAQVWNRLTCSVRSCFGIAPVFFSGNEPTTKFPPLFTELEEVNKSMILNFGQDDWLNRNFQEQVGLREV